MTDLVTFYSVWRAALSTILGTIKLWELLNADKVRLDSIYVFRSLDELDDEIVVSNLSPKPVQIANWSLEWRPKYFPGKSQSPSQQTTIHFGCFRYQGTVPKS